MTCSAIHRLRRQISSLLGGFPTSIRAGLLGAFPSVNIGITDDTIEIVAFAPDIHPAELEVAIDRGLLTISGERERAPAPRDGLRTYTQERVFGSFRRVLELPQTADPDAVDARYSNGCLTVSVGKRDASKPRAIAIQ